MSLCAESGQVGRRLAKSALCQKRPLPPFAERDVMECRSGVDRPQSALMLAARITLAHFSVSSTMNLPNAPGVIGIGVPPRSARRAFILGSSRAALTSLLSFATISAGVFLGAPIPYQLLPS